jgi:hypothetical protein
MLHTKLTVTVDGTVSLVGRYRYTLLGVIQDSFWGLFPIWDLGEKLGRKAKKRSSRGNSRKKTLPHFWFLASFPRTQV